MRKMFILAAIPLALASAASAEDKISPAAPRVDAAIKAAFPNPSPEWQARLTPDETMKACSAHENRPPAAVFEEISKREAASIAYPPDNRLVGDWKKGEALAQSGYGLRFSDYPPTRVNGGNCYACHQLTRAEVSYGTIGPSLLNYGKLRDFTPEATKAAYEKIYNPHATAACSLMPRFGANKVLTVEQIKDLVALLMDPDSPVNK
jgi:sulfur-oxidizing protein SoxX